MQMIKGAVAGLVALVACPCHLPLTLPVLLFVTSGTALGVWLAANQWFVWLASFILFAGGLGLAFIWFGRTENVSHCVVPRHTQKPALTTDAPGEGNLSRHPALITQTKEVSHV